ncbi:hypothetical protein BgiMline_012969 [Biomphalaria glabrata]|nr:hypothetical protein BgiMline_016783 [Biomphalaria glabrata]
MCLTSSNRLMLQILAFVLTLRFTECNNLFTDNTKYKLGSFAGNTRNKPRSLIESTRDKTGSLFQNTKDKLGSIESAKDKLKSIKSAKDKPESLDSAKNKPGPLKSTIDKPGSSEQIVFSCKNKCGSVVSLPCACDVVCQVYHNCCEDFYKECDSTILKFENTYKIFEHAQIDCSQDNIFFIASCYKKLVKENPASTTLKKEVTEDLTTTDQLKWTLNDIWRNMPVTDRNLRLVFKNRSISDCYSRNSTYLFMWNALFDYLEVIESEHNYYLSLFEIYTPSYEPPKGTGAFLQPPRCFASSIGDCSISKYKDLCSSFTSYVRAENMLVYDNVYCAQCAGLNDTSLLMPVTTVGSGSRPKISMSSTFNYDKVTFQTEDTSASQSWHILECVLDQESRNHLKCRITACNSVYYKFDHGQCLQLSVFSVAFFNLGVTPLSEEQPRISAYLTCLLKYYAEFILVGEWRPAQIVYYPQVYFLSNFLFYPSADSIGIFEMFVNRFNFHRLISISKLLKINLGRNKGKSKANKSLEDFEDMYVDTEYEELRVSGSLEKVSANLVKGYNTTTVCACTISLVMAEIISFHNSQICNYTCFKTPVYAGPVMYDNMCPLYDVLELNAFKRLQTDICTIFLFPLFWFVR